MGHCAEEGNRATEGMGRERVGVGVRAGAELVGSRHPEKGVTMVSGQWSMVSVHESCSALWGLKDCSCIPIAARESPN